MTRKKASAPTPAGLAIHAHKHFAPRALPTMVPRARVLDGLAAAGDARVVVLQAPAGHGKSTTLLQIKQACEARGVSTAWLTLDDADNEPRRFFACFRSLIQQLDGAVAAESDASGVRRHVDGMIAQLASLDRPVALFLDELQTVTSPLLLQFFRELMEYLPDNVTLYFGTRSVPEVGLSRLIVDGRAWVVSADMLRFSRDETRAFFDSARELEMRPDELESIYRRTEGWPAALQLFRLSLNRLNVRSELERDVSGQPRELADYLTENVLALQSPELQDFLLRTALLPRLSAPLCTEITGVANAQVLLEQLERNGLFLRALDADLQWFKYHGLFAKCLSDQFSARQPEVAREVHLRAARWYAAEHMWAEGVHHALAANEVGLAADMLDEWGSTLVAEGQLITLERWAQQLPLAEITARPTLTIKVAYAYVFLRRRAAFSPIHAALLRMELEGRIQPEIVLSMAAISADNVAEAFRRAQRVDIEKVDESGFDAFERAAAANLQGVRALSLGDFEHARVALGYARRHTERGVAPFSGGYEVGVTGISLMLQGDLQGALATFDAAAAQSPARLDRMLASAAMTACHVWALYEANELDAAEALFMPHQDMIAESTLLDFAAVAFIAMSRIDTARGRRQAAQDKLDALEQVAQASGWPRLMRLVGWERAARALAAGHHEYAQSLIANIAPDPGPPQPWVLFADELGEARFGDIRLMIQLGQLDRASRRLHEATEQAGGRVYRQIRLKLLEIAWHLQAGSEAAAQNSLVQALQLAAPGGLIRLFVEYGRRLLPLLLRLHHAPPPCLVRHGGYLARLVTACGGDPGADGGDRAPLEGLTEREQAILMLLSMGASNKEMARQMTVSENTVKFHLKNIYAKLAVDNRLRAIAAARERGLIT
ncbi:LuxR C-terminal-related transcriptional regulator [Polycyclovorans algicola]|uniref:LuxR C-terminal-related transcriptional regulator n=1 Tax=Polycyclovorans algicola TaxID=616992 RepID=UPI0004A6CEDC|nr:LuxR C-terminal-related transcriptional regulator [Polycyclovorans algicola]